MSSAEKKNHIRWGVFVALCWAILIGLGSYTYAVPASRWFTVHTFTVQDTVENKSPTMIVDRSIRRDFQARWVVSVMRRNAQGTAYFTYCVAQGANDYRPANVLPDELNLEWWTWPTKCSLTAGTYYVNTIWILHPPGFPTKELRVTSNTFNVTPAPTIATPQVANP